MAKSRSPLGPALLLLLVSPAAAAAQAPPGAGEAAVRGQQDQVRALLEECIGANPDEIVICRRRVLGGDDRHRLPLYRVAPGPPDRAGGEQVAAMGAGADRCSPVGRNQQCNGGIDVIGAAFTAGRIAKALIEGRD